MIDEYTVAYNYAEPFVPLWVGLSYSYCAPLSRSAVEAAGDAYGRNPVGTGPFKFVSWEPDQGITLEAYKEHTWASSYFKNSGPPYLDGAQYLIMPEDATRLAALQTGDIDMIAGSDAVPIDKIAQLEKIEWREGCDSPSSRSGLCVYQHDDTATGRSTGASSD